MAILLWLLSDILSAGQASSICILGTIHIQQCFFVNRTVNACFQQMSLNSVTLYACLKHCALLISFSWWKERHIFYTSLPFSLPPSVSNDHLYWKMSWFCPSSRSTTMRQQTRKTERTSVGLGSRKNLGGGETSFFSNTEEPPCETWKSLFLACLSLSLQGREGENPHEWSSPNTPYCIFL